MAMAMTSCKHQPNLTNTSQLSQLSPPDYTRLSYYIFHTVVMSEDLKLSVPPPTIHHAHEDAGAHELGMV